MSRPDDQEILDVLGYQRKALAALEQSSSNTAHEVSQAVQEAENLLSELGIDSTVVSPFSKPLRLVEPFTTPSWDELVHQSREAGHTETRIHDLLTPGKIRALDEQISATLRAVRAPYQLDVFDVAIAGIAGVLAGMTDVFLVQLPQGVQQFGKPVRESGPLGQWVRDNLNAKLPDHVRRSLERQAKVPYDPSTNFKLHERIEGLNPSTHRLHSVGHDPILGWIVGTADILLGRFTAIGSDGKLIRQVTFPDQQMPDLMQALATHFYHLLSDVNTPAGLPAPLMVLTQKLQFGRLTEHEYTIAELTRLMYRDGYDLRHFMTASIPVFLIEVFVRVAMILRLLVSGLPLREVFRYPGLQKTSSVLCLAHGIAAGINAGKVYFTANPLAVSFPQWTALARYLLPELKLRLFDLPQREEEALEALKSQRWQGINQNFEQLWQGQAQRRGVQ